MTSPQSKTYKVDVSIIIVNYNTEDVLDNCIQSVMNKTSDIDYEIIVVDNNSKQGSLTTLTQKYPSVIFHKLDKNLGFGQANNEGAKIANGEYLFLLNPDTLLINNALNILHNFMLSNPKTGICGGNMYKGDMTPASSYYDVDFLKLEYKIIFNQKRTVGFNHTDKPKEVNVIVGADLFISKQLFQEFEGFDADFFMYFEEVELCNRVQNAGYTIMSVPAAQIIHLQGASAENRNEELGKWSYKEHWYSKLIYFHKVKGKCKTQTVYHISLLKLRLASILAKLRKDKHKIEYWTQKEQVMKDTYNRYLSYLDKQS